MSGLLPGCRPFPRLLPTGAPSLLVSLASPLPQPSRQPPSSLHSLSLKHMPCIASHLAAIVKSARATPCLCSRVSERVRHFSPKGGHITACFTSNSYHQDPCAPGTGTPAKTRTGPSAHRRQGGCAAQARRPQIRKIALARR